MIVVIPSLSRLLFHVSKYRYMSFFSGHIVLHGIDAAWADSQINLFYFPDDISEANQ